MDILELRNRSVKRKEFTRRRREIIPLPSSIYEDLEAEGIPQKFWIMAIEIWFLWTKEEIMEELHRLKMKDQDGPDAEQNKLHLIHGWIKWADPSKNKEWRRRQSCPNNMRHILKYYQRSSTRLHFSMKFYRSIVQETT